MNPATGGTGDTPPISHRLSPVLTVTNPPPGGRRREFSVLKSRLAPVALKGTNPFYRLTE